MHRLLTERLGNHAIARQLVPVPLDQNHGIQGAAVDVAQRAFDDAPRAGGRIHDSHNALNVHQRPPSRAAAAAPRAAASRIRTTLPPPEIVAPWYRLEPSRKSMGFTTESSLPKTSETTNRPRSVNTPSTVSRPRRSGRPCRIPPRSTTGTVCVPSRR